jgi:oxygen-independent coproporphyrinogen-3 oxidase
LAGIYLHIPFCRKACNYCNFHFSTGLRGKNDFLKALLKEIELTPFFEGNPGIETIYFGGGTPSLLERFELSSIVDALFSKFNIPPGAEVTLEANPDDVNHEILEDWLSLGVNRLSLGVQSFYDEDLVWMNRAHNREQAIHSIRLIKDAGFSNFSADLIYGMPTLNDEHWKKNVDMMVELGVPHLSCYALTVESRTALSKMILTKQVKDVDPGQQAEQFLMLIQWLRSAGYEHYEISNFAKPGMRSKHNSAYWRGIWYYGFGPSAHSFSGNERKWNVANNALYQQSLLQEIIPTETEEISTEQQLNEYVMVSLRTSSGIDLHHVEKKFGNSEKIRIRETGQKYIVPGKLIEENGFLRLTDDGKLFADGIAADMFK